MFIVESDLVVRVEPNTTPAYNSNNSLIKLVTLMQKTPLGAEREHYLADSLQYLFPYSYLEIYGPSSPNTDNLNPTTQDFKNDFQKQNVKDFHTTDTHLIRGWVSAGNWTGAFLRLSYQAGPDSILSKISNNKLGSQIKVFLQVGNSPGTIINVPYNQIGDRYEVEIWGYPGNNLRDLLADSPKARSAFDRGEIIARNDLIHGSPNDFSRDTIADLDMRTVAPNNAMHPILPLHLQLAWTDSTEQFWDSQNGKNYQYEFNMVVRGRDSFLKVGVSPNPHGGIGFLEYRNLLSNYFEFANSGELGRQLESWNLDAFSNKVLGGAGKKENFFSIDYMDLHIMRPECGIGLHRHRDNQEIFFMVDGRGLMVVGDWAKFPNRERCFEIRTLTYGHFAMLKGGNLHGLMNVTDENSSLFMFGGYD